MANYLDANPDEAERVKGAQWGGLVPIVRGGRIIALANRRNLAFVAPDAAITTEDYVVGLEVLGHVFTKAGTEWEGMSLPSMPEAWREHSHALQRAFGDARYDELVAFLDARDAEA
jgi:hypothetical protein